MSELERMPAQLGSYHLAERVGEGGMGVVYRARAGQRDVALKVLRPSVAGDPTARLRLAREVETMRRVHSPFVAEVIDADLTADLPYIVTAYVPGRTLDEVVTRTGPLRGEALAALARGLADALCAVHAAGVVHRDLKPGNVMLVDGSPVVIDFGIAQRIDTTRLTMTGMFMGTPGYLSPEIIEGHPSSGASDVHAWGATVAFAATGRPPFGSGPYETIFYRIVNGQPDLAGAPSVLLPMLAAALAREPAHRPTAAALSQQATALDPQALVANLVNVSPPAGPNGVAPATRADAASVGRMPGAHPGDGAVAGVWPGSGQGPAGVPPANGAVVPSYPAPAVPPDDYADLLPPAVYQAGAALAPRQPLLMPGPGAAAGPSISRAHPVLVVASMLILACLSVILPVAGGLIAMTVIVLLRGGELAHSAAVRRRPRGSRLRERFVAAVSFPWFVVRSLLTCLLLAPFAAAAGAVAGGISIAATPGQPLVRALAYGIGALVAFYGIGPGSGRPRRQLGRFYLAVTPTRLSQVVAVAGIVALAIAALAAAASWAPYYWPTGPPGQLPLHLGAMPARPLSHVSVLAGTFLARLRGL